MKINLRALAIAPNARIDFDYTIDLSKEEVHFGFPFPEPVRLRGFVQDQSGAVSLSGEIEAQAHVRCARCNAPVVYGKQVPVHFLLARALPEEDADDVFVIDGDEVDPEEVMVPELLLDMEMAVLCREDCRGLCPKCGKNLNDGDCGCVRSDVDPRWGALQRILEKNKD
jgi:uncharacterized protein